MGTRDLSRTHVICKEKPPGKIGLERVKIAVARSAHRRKNGTMEYDKDKVDEVVLALLYLTICDRDRAWKGHDWDALGRLHEKGMIYDPVGKTKSVHFTEEGLKRCEELFEKHFGLPK